MNSYYDDGHRKCSALATSAWSPIVGHCHHPIPVAQVTGTVGHCHHLVTLVAGTAGFLFLSATAVPEIGLHMGPNNLCYVFTSLFIGP